MSPEVMALPVFSRIDRADMCGAKSAARARTRTAGVAGFDESADAGSAGVDAGEHRLAEPCGGPRRPFDIAAVRLLRHRERGNVERQ